MSQLAGKMGGNKKGETSFEINFPFFVGCTGFEPVTLTLST